MRKILFSGIAIAVLTLFLFTGCSQGPGGKAPVAIRGVIVNPENTCYFDFEPNPVIVEGVPLPHAEVTILGDQGRSITAVTDSKGTFSFLGQAGEAYVLYAKKGDIRVKRGIATLVASQDIGEANYFTTAQVIIWEVANELYPGALAIKDISGIDPGDELPEAVKEVLERCQDAQKDPGVRTLAESIVTVLFGAPEEGGGVPEGGEEETPTPTPTPSPTPTPTPTVAPSPSPGCLHCPPPPPPPPVYPR